MLYPTQEEAFANFFADFGEIALNANPRIDRWWKNLNQAKGNISSVNDTLYVRLANLQSTLIIQTSEADFPSSLRLKYVTKLLQDLHDQWQQALKSGRCTESCKDSAREEAAKKIKHDLVAFTESIIKSAPVDEIPGIRQDLENLFKVSGITTIDKIALAAAFGQIVEKNKDELPPLTVFRAGAFIARHTEHCFNVQKQAFSLISDGLIRYGADGGNVVQLLKPIRNVPENGLWFPAFVRDELEAFSPYNRLMRWIGKETQPNSIAAHVHALIAENRRANFDLKQNNPV